MKQYRKNLTYTQHYSPRGVVFVIDYKVPWEGGLRGYVKAEERELCLDKLEVIQARERGDNHDSGGLWPC